MKFFAPLLKFLKQGMTPERLALCVAIGIVVGNIPILGISTILCTVIALLFRLNLPAVQLVQAFMGPTQLVLIIPYVRLGEWLLGAPHQPLSVPAALALMRQGVWRAVITLWDAILHAGFAWLLVAPPVTYVLYKIFARVFTHVAARMDGPVGSDVPSAQPSTGSSP